MAIVAREPDVEEQGVTVHPMASYSYFSWDGGHDDLFEIGAQLRKPVGKPSTLWVGYGSRYRHAT